jgi:hypothetical protein
MSVDMSKVKIGTRVKYRSGKPSVITHVIVSSGIPFCTDYVIWHKPDGSCCVDTLPEYDIVEIIEDAVRPTQPAKPPRKRSAPLYGELLNERELLKMDNHNLRSENDRLRDSLNAYRLASLFGIVALWFRNRKGGGK